MTKAATMSRFKLFIHVFGLALVGFSIGEVAIHGTSFSIDKVLDASFWAACGSLVGRLLEEE